MLKYFDKSQYALRDTHAKEVSRQFWIKLSYNFIESLDKYGIDLLVERKGRKFGCEVEVKFG